MTDESKRTPRAVLWAALLHVGVAAFLFLTTLSCTSWEQVFAALHLPAGWSPVTCQRPQALRGPVIEATLVGVSSTPSPPPIEVKASKPAPPPPPEPEKIVVKQETPEVPPLQTLPPPPKHPDTHNQQKVVAKAKNKAKQAEHEQHERQQQHMSELEAKQRQAKLNKIFQQLHQAQQASQNAAKRSRLEQQKLAQLKDLQEAKKKAPAPPPGVEGSRQVRSGGNGVATDAYKAAIQNAVTRAWLRPDNIPQGAVCPIHIVQIPGGQVVSVTIEPSCPFDAAARRSVKNAVLRAQPLPYKGFEKAFRSDLTLNFKVEH